MIVDKSTDETLYDEHRLSFIDNIKTEPTILQGPFYTILIYWQAGSHQFLQESNRTRKLLFIRGGSSHFTEKLCCHSLKQTHARALHHFTSIHCPEEWGGEPRSALLGKYNQSIPCLHPVRKLKFLMKNCISHEKVY